MILRLTDQKTLKVVQDVRYQIKYRMTKQNFYHLVSGRGLLGHWGPNHAGDPVVTRWAKDDKHKVLEIILVKRKDTGELALPGGMVDAG